VGGRGTTEVACGELVAGLERDTDVGTTTGALGADIDLISATVVVATSASPVLG
jgi:hypothetical protein